jgi:hypothetical protein
MMAAAAVVVVFENESESTANPTSNGHRTPPYNVAMYPGQTERQTMYRYVRGGSYILGLARKTGQSRLKKRAEGRVVATELIRRRRLCGGGPN